MLAEPEYYNCTAGPDTNLSRGMFDIKLNPVVITSRGSYILMSTLSSPNALRCVNLQVLGKKPKAMHIEIISCK